jgi:hypothetical protein
MLRNKHSHPTDIMNGLVPETVQKGNYRFRLIEQNVKQQLILRSAKLIEEAFVVDFIAYLSLIDDTKLDGYNTLTFYIQEFDAQVYIVTPSPSDNLIIEIPSLKRGPPKELMKKGRWYSRIFGLSGSSR